MEARWFRGAREHGETETRVLNDLHAAPERPTAVAEKALHVGREHLAVSATPTVAAVRSAPKLFAIPKEVWINKPTVNKPTENKTQ
jgi:hypothetical protein